MRITKRMVRKLLILSEELDGTRTFYTAYNPLLHNFEKVSVKCYEGVYYWFSSNDTIEHYSPLECAYDGILDWYKRNGIEVYDV